VKKILQIEVGGVDPEAGQFFYRVVLGPSIIFTGLRGKMIQGIADDGGAPSALEQGQEVIRAGPHTV